MKNNPDYDKKIIENTMSIIDFLREKKISPKDSTISLLMLLGDFLPKFKEIIKNFKKTGQASDFNSLIKIELIIDFFNENIGFLIAVLISFNNYMNSQGKNDE
jgi:hypothetical protein